MKITKKEKLIKELSETCWKDIVIKGKIYETKRQKYLVRLDEKWPDIPEDFIFPSNSSTPGLQILLGDLVSHIEKFNPKKSKMRTWACRRMDWKIMGLRKEFEPGLEDVYDIPEERLAYLFDVVGNDEEGNELRLGDTIPSKDYFPINEEKSISFKDKEETLSLKDKNPNYKNLIQDSFLTSLQKKITIIKVEGIFNGHRKTLNEIKRELEKEGVKTSTRRIRKEITIINNGTAFLDKNWWEKNFWIV